MDLELTSDQELFRDTTRQFLQAEAPLASVRAWADTPAGFPRAWWKRGAELGWTSLLVSEERGGGSISGLGLGDLALVAEEMGTLVSPGPLSPVNVIAETIPRNGSDEQADRYLPGLLRGDSVAAWCVAEPGRAVRAEEIALLARPDAGEFVLAGTKSPVEAGADADWFLVRASAIGVTWDHDIHLYLRRAVLHREIYGDPAEHRDQVASLAAPAAREMSDA